MADNTKIEWAEATWNPIIGCTKVSPGCDNCYAERIVNRFKGKGAFDTVQLSEEKLGAPLRWRRPRRVFVNSMSDLFHNDVPDAFIARVFAVMAATPQHTYQLLTKRHGRMRSLLRGVDGSGHRLIEAAADEATALALYEAEWPLRNLWLGVSVEDQQRADLRIPALLDTPAAVRWLSCEPLLGPVDLSAYLDRMEPAGHEVRPDVGTIAWYRPQLGWVVVGGESGPGARPMLPQWARSLRDQCTAAEVPFFFKQYGEWAPTGWRGIALSPTNTREQLVGPALDDMGHREVIARVGKKAAGRVLDGRTWDQYPAGTAVPA